MEKIRYCIISHTHWDREWYLPFEVFRMRLVDLMDHLLDILDVDPGYRFHLDAQTIVLEDYLEIRPDKRAALEKYVREGRLLVGPWYVQNDFHLTSGEATVRNLLIGTRIAESFGGSMPVGYAADQFGLCSQLPQILTRFGLDSCVFGRGYAREASQFRWASEDGSTVLCEHMFAWYNNAQRFPDDPEAALRLTRERGAACLSKGRTHDCLLMNGVDHLEAQENLTEIVGKVRPLLNDNEEFFQDTLPDYIARYKETVAREGIDLPVVTGELRDLGAPNVLTGVLAARVHLKEWNAYLQAVLEKRLEPLYAGAAWYGLGGFPQDYMDYLWKTLIKNHPHDSICGCSVDPVHTHMVDRFLRIRENADDLLRRGDDSILSHVDRTGLDKSQFLIVDRSTTLEPWNGPLEAVIDIPAGDDSGSFTLTDPKGREVPFEVVSVRKNVAVQVLSPINLPGEKRVNRYTIRYRAGVLPGMSHRTLVLTPVPGGLTAASPRRRSAYRMENDTLKVRIGRNGTVELTHKPSGITYHDVLLLEDNADRGTAYNYDEVDDGELVTSAGVRAKVSVLTDTPLCQQRKITYTLPLDRECGKGDVDVETVLTLRKGVDRLDVDMTVDNRCTHHRLRVRVPTGIVTDHNYAGQPFDVITRDKVSRYADDRTHPMTDFAGLDAPDGSHGLSVFALGLYEYEHQDASGVGACADREGVLAVTLLRCFERITGDYAHENDMAESWKAYEGQAQGLHRYRLAVCPYAGDHETAGIARRAAQFMAEPVTAVRPVDVNRFYGGRPFVQGPGLPDLFFRPLEHADRVVPRADVLFRLVGESVPGAMVLSACKGAEARDGSLILRFYNSTSKPVTFGLRFTDRIRGAWQTNLREIPTALLTVTRGHALSLSAAPKEIITVKILK
ncbi:MAG: glycosyl hydrolase-related protein [Clostridia bacterium]|nr:glycosyl hydrolase-related protein [Clostridia bacterium]